jgi:hypothetical protein
MRSRPQSGEQLVRTLIELGLIGVVIWISPWLDPSCVSPCSVGACGVSASPAPRCRWETPAHSGSVAAASSRPRAATAPAPAAALAPAAPPAQRSGCPGPGSSRRADSRSPSCAHRALGPTSERRADLGRSRSGAASRWPDRAASAPTRSHPRADPQGRLRPPAGPARLAGSRRRSNGSGRAEQVTQAIARAPIRQRGRAGRTAVLAAMNPGLIRISEPALPRIG